MNTNPRRALGAVLTLAWLAIAGCGDDDTKETAMEPGPTTTTTAHAPAGGAAPRDVEVAANGTTLAATVRGDGPPLLLIHGGGEDAAMLDAQADDLVAGGHQVITYDRRGTGRSGRAAWPGGGAEQHAADAAALLEHLADEPATVVGVSSGGVVALQLVASHPQVVERAVVWEPPAAGLVPGGEAATAAIMEPIEAHLAANPGDFVGAQALLLTELVGFPVTADDPAFAATRANAEPMVVDEPAITLARPDAAALAGADLTVGIGDQPNELITAAVAELERITGRAPVTVAAPHEVYLSDPSVLTGIVAGAT